MDESDEWRLGVERRVGSLETKVKDLDKTINGNGTTGMYADMTAFHAAYYAKEAEKSKQGDKRQRSMDRRVNLVIAITGIIGTLVALLVWLNFHPEVLKSVL